MDNLGKRTITGVLFVILILGSVILNPFVFSIVIGVFVYLGSLEYQKLLQKKEYSYLTPSVYGVLSSLIYVISSLIGLNQISNKYYSIILILCFTVMFFSLFIKSRKNIESLTFSLLGFIYIPISFSLLNHLTNFNPIDGSYNYQIILGFFIILWTNDVFAYLTGCKFGKHKLFERVSPKKTWEGSIGGGLFALIFSVAFGYFYDQNNLIDWIVLGVIIPVTGSYGDLFESQFKRFIGVKDSGDLLPGHGGVLDRFDAALMALPFVFVYLLIFS